MAVLFSIVDYRSPADLNLYNLSYVYQRNGPSNEGIVSLGYIIPVEEEKAVRELSVSNDLECPIEKQCIEYVKSKGVAIPGQVKYAKNILPNINEPCVGCGVLLFADWRGHLGFIEEVSSSNILISERNYFGCGIISTRSIGLDDPRIRGFVK